MKVSELVRKLPFDFYNIVTRNKLVNLLETRKKNETSHFVKLYVQEKENNIKNHAYYTTFFYSKHPEFPVISKKDIQSNIDGFISNKFKKKDLDKITTSGSYGTPSVFYKNSEKKKNQIADVLYYGGKNGYFFGIKHAFIRGVEKPKKSLFIQNEIHLSPNKLGKKAMEEYYLKLKKVSYIVGFPSVLLRFIEFCKEYKLKPLKNIEGILCTAEPLTLGERKVISDFFECDVITRYASEEVGIIANRLPEEDFYRINENSVKLEIYKMDEDVPQEAGEEGRIIVTDFFSHAMPLINYDTGDLGVVDYIEEDNDKVKILKEITGRLVEQIYDENDEGVSPFAINVYLKEFDRLGQFQFVQESKSRYTLLLTNKLDNEYKDRIENGLKSILGENTNIFFEHIDEIPSLSSGKRPYIRNDYKK